jgi:Recombination endonuclease VII
MRLINYGCTNDQFEAMLATQQGKCAICQSSEVNTHRGRLRRLSVDHDHATGTIRGLLCGACNTGLASLQHDPGVLEAAIAYLDAHAADR